MKIRQFVILALLAFISITPATQAYAQGNPAVVRAVLFYSPTCPHCHLVINETLLPMMDQYGEQLEIISVDVTQAEGQAIFLAALQTYGLEQGGVPFLVIDDLYLIGSQEIPEKFPALVESYLARGGVDWPNLPGLSELIPQTPEAEQVVEPITTSPSDEASPSTTGQQGTSWVNNFTRDPAGNTLAVVVLAGMMASFVWTVNYFRKKSGISRTNKRAWVIPVLCVIGFGVAGYLSYVETAQVAAVCGPVGDCNTVQQSEFARLFGVLPIGILGLIGYIVILGAWVTSRFASKRMADFAAITLLALTASGTLFSIYLTFLEPFVIGATCAWCLTSAIIMTLLMLFVARPAKAAYSRLAGS